MARWEYATIASGDPGAGERKEEDEGSGLPGIICRASKVSDIYTVKASLQSFWLVYVAGEWGHTVHCISNVLPTDVPRGNSYWLALVTRILTRCPWLQISRSNTAFVSVHLAFRSHQPNILIFNRYLYCYSNRFYLFLNFLNFKEIVMRDSIALRGQ